MFLPDEAGPVDSARARGLLAHELVHAVQQRTLGTRLPAPDSPHGQALEAEAQAAERYYAGEAGAAPPPLIHAPALGPAPAEPDLSSAQLATALPAQPLHTPFDDQTRAEVGKIAETSAKQVVAQWTNPALTKQTGGDKKSGGDKKAGDHKEFDRAARRRVLQQQTLDTINAERVKVGQPPQQELDDIQRQRLEHALDQEQATQQPGARSTSQRPAPNSAAAWLGALTGMSRHESMFGVTGAVAKPGSAESWFAGDEEPAKDGKDGKHKDEKKSAETKPAKRKPRDLLSAIGLSNDDAANQFDTASWWESEEDTAKDTKPDKEDGVDIDKIDLDELSGRLYDRLRSRLRLELLVDRERSGLLTDFR